MDPSGTPHLRFSGQLLNDTTGCVITPFGPLPPGTPSVNAGDLAELRCSLCGGYATPWSGPGGTCILCGATHKAMFPDHELRQWKSVELVSPLSPAAATSYGYSLVLVLDGNLLKSELEEVTFSVASALSALGPDGGPSWLSLIVFTRVVTVYRCGAGGGIASADVFPDLSTFLCSPEHQRHSYVGPISSSKGPFLDALKVLRGARMAAPAPPPDRPSMRIRESVGRCCCWACSVPHS